MEKKNIAIMGGTFNPIHIGHLIAAQWVYDTGEYDKIVFMPSGEPPHKTDVSILCKNERYKLCKLAIEGTPYFEVSDFELNREGYTYTIDTIKYLKKHHDTANYWLIIGTDSLLDIFTWHKPEKLLKICNFILVNRASYIVDDIEYHIKMLQNNYNANIKSINIPNIEISSSNIRNRIINNKPIKCLVPEKVEQYIVLNNLYNHNIKNIL
jgi:nicotinate-nucleotide adenylyltransferase